MSPISIFPEPQSANGSKFRAMSGQHQGVGKTAGEALDALTSQLNGSVLGPLLVIPQSNPDRFFTAAQQTRLAELMGAWRFARDRGTHLSAEEQSELEQLTAEELQAAKDRASALLKGQQP
jgi:hypothetical protein